MLAATPCGADILCVCSTLSLGIKERNKTKGARMDYGLLALELISFSRLIT